MRVTSVELISRLGIHETFPDEHFLDWPVIILHLVFEVKFHGLFKVVNGLLHCFAEAGDVYIQALRDVGTGCPCKRKT